GNSPKGRSLPDPGAEGACDGPLHAAKPVVDVLVREYGIRILEGKPQGNALPAWSDVFVMAVDVKHLRPRQPGASGFLDDGQDVPEGRFLADDDGQVPDHGRESADLPDDGSLPLRQGNQ